MASAAALKLARNPKRLRVRPTPGRQAPKAVCVRQRSGTAEPPDPLLALPNPMPLPTPLASARQTAPGRQKRKVQAGPAPTDRDSQAAAPPMARSA